MKIALCLFGHVGGKKIKDGTVSGDIDISRTYNSYKKMIMEGNNVDLFIHSWSADYKNKIIRLYQPTEYLIEQQKDFSFVNIEDYSKTHLETYAPIFSAHGEKSFDKLRELAIRSTSRWYSNCKVLQIMNSYSEMNNISYDYVFQGRLDLLFLKKSTLVI